MPNRNIIFMQGLSLIHICFIIAVVQKLRNTAEDRARLRRLSDISENTKKPSAGSPE